ncbi:hypothetical protein ACFV16_35670 [Streptomyces massasporeus]|uniref:hypothetical protein n=1 Tax=Streptomyces massasporeus TaxID=67324 RepID=UPI0036B86053
MKSLVTLEPLTFHQIPRTMPVLPEGTEIVPIIDIKTIITADAFCVLFRKQREIAHTAYCRKFGETALKARVDGYANSDKNIQKFALMELLSKEAEEAEGLGEKKPEVEERVGVQYTEVRPGVRVAVSPKADGLGGAIVATVSGGTFNVQPPQPIVFSALNTRISIADSDQADKWSLGFVQTVRDAKRSFTFCDAIDGVESHYLHKIETNLSAPANDRNEGVPAPWYGNTSFTRKIPGGNSSHAVFFSDRPGMDSELQNKQTAQQMKNGVLLKMSGADVFNTSLILLGPDSEVHVLYHWDWVMNYTERKVSLSGEGEGGSRDVIVLNGERAGKILNAKPNTVDLFPTNPNMFTDSSSESEEEGDLHEPSSHDGEGEPKRDKD